MKSLKNSILTILDTVMVQRVKEMTTDPGIAIRLLINNSLVVVNIMDVHLKHFLKKI